MLFYHDTHINPAAGGHRLISPVLVYAISFLFTIITSGIVDYLDMTLTFNASFIVTRTDISILDSILKSNQRL